MQIKKQRKNVYVLECEREIISKEEEKASERERELLFLCFLCARNDEKDVLCLFCFQEFFFLIIILRKSLSLSLYIYIYIFSVASQIYTLYQFHSEFFESFSIASFIKRQICKWTKKMLISIKLDEKVNTH
jgi:hypothetical protein